VDVVQIKVVGLTCPATRRGKWRVCTRPIKCTKCQCSGLRLPEGAATVRRQRQRKEIMNNW